MTIIVDNWGNEDKLNRKDSADFLSNFLIKRYALASKHGRADTFVLNVRADWGFGKTFFLRRWAKDLAVNYPVVFFDAWTNDFSDDPLIGFIAEINNALSNHFKSIPAAERYLDSALAVGRKLIKPVGLVIASAITKQLSGLSLQKLSELYSTEGDDKEDVDEEKNRAGSEVSSLISQYAELALQEHLSKKETISVFKKRLGRLIDALQKEAGVQLPLFVFIDELDRCRPTYAIELLEAVKHLFGVPGIYFVVATNLEQLGHSICAVYGERFDSERYLKRFFDQEYLLPLPDNTQFTAFLFERYSLGDFGETYSVIEKGVYGETPPEHAVFSILTESFGLGPRDQEQVAGALQAVLLNWPSGERIHLAYLLFLIIAKQKSTKLFQDISENRLMDNALFQKMLTNHLLPESKFKTKTIRNDGGGAVDVEHTVLDLLWSYHSVMSRSYSEILKHDYNIYRFPEKILRMISNDAPRDWQHGKEPINPLAYYARRVSQAGQLTVPIG